MKLVFEYIGLIFLLLILALSIWNTINLCSIKNSIKRSGNYSKEYFEIKYRLQLLSTIGSIVAAVIIYLGYNSEKMIEDSVVKTVTESMKKTVTDSIQKNVKIVKDTFDIYLDRIKSTENTIRKIENKEIINAEIYIIGNYKIRSIDYLNKSTKIYYKDLGRTISGKILPVFKNPPVINLIPKSGTDHIIKNVTKDYFELELQAYSYEISSFDIWFAL